MKRLLIAGLAVLVLAASGPAAIAGGPNTQGNIRLTPDGPIYVRLDRIIISLFRGGAVERQIGYMLLLEVANEKIADGVRELRPRLMDAFVRELNMLAAGPRVADEGIDPALMKRRLIAVGGRVLGEGAIRDVLVEKSYGRRLS